MLVSLFDDPAQAREADISRIFEDLCSSFSGNATGFVSFEMVKRPLLLELLESILAAGSRLFKIHPSLIDANLLPSLLNTVRDEKSSFLLVVRALRISSLLLPSKEALVLGLLQILPQASEPRQVMILEALEVSIGNIPEMRYTDVVQTLLLYEDSLPGLGTYSIASPPRAKNEEITLDGLIYTETADAHSQEGLGSWTRPARRLTAQLNLGDAPKINPNYKYYLMFQLVSTLSLRPSTIWKDLLVILSAFLSSSISSSMETSLLSDFSKATVSLNALPEKRPRDLYLRRLGRVAVSSSLTSEDPTSPKAFGAAPGDPSQRSFSCLHTFLGTIVILRDSFDIRSWLQVLEILSSAESLLTHKSRRGRNHSGSIMSGIMNEERSPSIGSNTASDMSRLSVEIQQFFQTSNEISDESFSALIEALCTLQKGVPGSPSPMTPTGSLFSSPVSHRGRDSLSSFSALSLTNSATASLDFSLDKLRELLPSNIRRFVDNDESCGWSTLLDHLTRQIEGDSLIAAEILGLLITKAVQANLKTAAQQKRFVFALQSITGDGEIRVTQINTVASILEVLGHDLTCGWDLILEILQSIASEGPLISPDALRTGFSCLQLICTDLLRVMPEEQKSQLIETIVSYASQKQSVNISLSAVGQFWTILDSLPMVRDFTKIHEQHSPSLEDGTRPSEESLWLLYMESLIHVCQDNRPETRNSAIQACFRAINKLQLLGISAFMSSLHLLLEGLHVLSLRLRPESESVIDTVSFITTGTGRTLFAAIDVLDKTDHLVQVWKLVLHYLEATARSPRVEIASTALSTILEISTSIPSGLETSSTIWNETWLMVANCGSAMFSDSGELQQMTQEGLTIYLQVLAGLCENSASNLEADRLDTLMALTYQALTYKRSQTYYLDVDYLSAVQKAAMALCTTLLKGKPNHKKSLLIHLSKYLKLAPQAHLSVNEYVFVAATKSSNSGTTWTGRPTFMAFAFSLHESIAKEYDAGCDSELQALSCLMEAMNYSIDGRFSRVSVSNKAKTHELWKTSTTQILQFIKLVESRLYSTEAHDLWPHIVDTATYLFAPSETHSEEFVLASLNTLRGLIVPKLGSQSKVLVERYVEALYRGSWFYPQSEMTEPSTVMAEYYSDFIIREWCLFELFKLSIMTSTSTSTTTMPKEKEGKEEETTVCADIALRFVSKRASNILSRFVNNASLRLHQPLSKVEYSELLSVLNHLSDETITGHANQRVLLKGVYVVVIDALVIIGHGDPKLLALLKNVLLRIGEQL